MVIFLCQGLEGFMGLGLRSFRGFCRNLIGML